MGRKVFTPASEGRLRAFKQAGGENQLHRLIKDAQRLANGPGSFEEKADGLVDISESISKTITPHMACAKGCNHCCYMAVAVSDYEADMIGRYLGRDKATVAGTDIVNFELRGTVEKFSGTPCPMLAADGKCSVYPVRPVACRNHHNVAADESNCVVAGHDYTKTLPTTPAINLDGFLVFYAQVFFKRAFADIREWFPPKEQQ